MNKTLTKEQLKQFKGLYNYFYSYSSSVGICSNFSSAIQIIENEQNWGVRNRNTTADDWGYIQRAQASVKQVSGIRNARMALYALQEPHRSVLTVSLYEAPGKFSVLTNQLSKVRATVNVSKNVNVDLSALCFYFSKHNTIQDFENFSVNHPKEFKLLFNKANKAFNEALGEYFQVYREI